MRLVMSSSAEFLGNSDIGSAVCVKTSSRKVGE
jgi:hypothetical protein